MGPVLAYSAPDLPAFFNRLSGSIAAEHDASK